MTPALHSWLWQRAAPWAVLLVPGLAGLGFLAGFGAPPPYVAINGLALVIGCLWIAFGKLPSTLLHRRVLTAALLAFLLLPLFVGPEVENVRRWLSINGILLHTGSLAVPLLVCLAARDKDYASPILLAGAFATLLQPDAASAFAIMLAAVGLYFAWTDWKVGIVAILSFIVALLAALRGELPAQPFVERILPELFPVAPIVALGLALTLYAAFFIILRATPSSLAVRYALAGAFAGFCITALMSNYPYPLIAYGASPIIGLALALTVQKHAHSEGQITA